MAVLYIGQTKQWRFSEQYRKVQCKTCFAITGEIQGTCRMKIYDELGLHSLTIRRWRIKLIFFCKIVNGLLPDLNLYTAKKWSFPLRISSVNVTKSEGNCGFGHIYWGNL